MVVVVAVVVVVEVSERRDCDEGLARVRLSPHCVWFTGKAVDEKSLSCDAVSRPQAELQAASTPRV